MKWFKVFTAGVLLAAAVYILGRPNTEQITVEARLLEKHVQILEKNCQEENQKSKASPKNWSDNDPSVCNAEQLIQLDPNNQSDGIQPKIVETQQAYLNKLSENNRRWHIFASIGILIISCLPWVLLFLVPKLWYSFLDRLRELSSAICAKKENDRKGN
ncbi:MAG: hypothetical protein K2Q32_01780 [Alphaproteobacteria bacterium]|nr:hypothetical protein [Alphaproteobacteria bacterium]